MISVGIVTNPLDPRTWEEYQADDARQLLVERFSSWPSSARIFDLEGFGDWRRAAALIDPAVLASRDVTPRDEAGVERLGQLHGPLLVTIPPADPLTAIIAVVAIAVGVAAAFLLMPKLPSAGRQPSPNNSLSDRANQARPNQRIPDIFGTVEATPDLLMVPYTIFENNREVEVAYMGVGRGSYAITRVRDGDTALASIAGASAAIYGPNTSPNSGDAPQLQIGAPIPDPVRSVVKLNEVNGQTLKPTNLNQVQGEDSIRFVYPDRIETNDTNIRFTEYFDVGDAIAVQQADISGAAGNASVTADARYTAAGLIEFDTFDPRAMFAAGNPITIANAGFAGDDGLGGVLYTDVSGTYEIGAVGPSSITLVDPSNINGDWDRLSDYPADRTEYRSGTFSTPTASDGINLNGNYTILALDDSGITLNNPQLVNASWANLADLEDQATDYVSPNISRSSETWIGPYIVDLDDATELLANIVASNGLFTLSKKKGQQRAISVGIVLEVTPVNQNDAATGPAQMFPGAIAGSDTERTSVGLSLFAQPTFSGRSSIRMRRTTPTPADEDYGSVVDEVKWRDAYGLAPVDQPHFGDITTVMTRTIATAGALSIKNRKLNMRVTRKLPARIAGAQFGPAAATDSAADIMAAMSLDPFIGRREPSEVDFDSLYDTIADVVEYFGSPLAGQFGFTFDDTDVSFEESLQTVAQAVFCRGYRQGRVIRLSFERATDQSSLIFNSRNVIGGSQKRTFRFGPLDDHDGVELDWTDPEDGAPRTYKVPTDRSSTSARSAEIPGVRSYLLAYWQTWRAWNKIRYQNEAVDLEATQEAALVVPNDRVLIADRTRPGIIQGECQSLNGTTLQLSTPADLDPAKHWTIFLQHVDETVEALTATPGSDATHVELSAPPRMPLSLDAANFAKATYIIVPGDDVQTRAFLVSEREPQSNFTESVKAVNYSFLYYQHDELIFWLDFGASDFLDSGPYLFDPTPAGGPTLANDPDRGRVYRGSSAGDYLTLPSGQNGLTASASYTKAAWIKKNDLAETMGGILSSAANDEAFFISNGRLASWHNAGTGEVSAPWPAAGEWHHAAVCYDAEQAITSLFIDGKLVEQGSTPQRSLGALVAFGISSAFGLIGYADDLRLWKRALEPSEIKAVYLSSKQAA